jgi:transcriptional regulator with XRE-family HTH domain
MGKRARKRPKHLAEKLLRIRVSLGLTQTELWKRLELDEYLPYTVISGYERGVREPAIEVLLGYARLAGVPMEFLADDQVDLPEHLPVKADYRRARKRIRVHPPQK